MTSLWNDRWTAMSFGPHRFRSTVMPGHVFLRFLLFYLLPFIMLGVMTVFAFTGGLALLMGPEDPDNAATGVAAFLMAGVFALVLYGLTGLIALAYYAKFFREAVGNMSLSTLDFEFSARSKDWLKLILGDIALVILTFGIGIVFPTYRHWRFFINHLDARGEISMASLTQSTTNAPGQGEGLAEAFDMGAI